MTFAVLAVAFAPDFVAAVSESTGPVRCLSLKTGAENWRHTPNPGTHFISLAFCESLDLFVGIEWQYQAGGNHRLVSLTRSSGCRATMANIPESSKEVFCASGSLLVTSEGDVVEVESGKIVRKLDFPREVYEEPEFSHMGGETANRHARTARISSIIGTSWIPA